MSSPERLAQGDAPSVSVIIATYNDHEHLGQAIRSCQVQTLTNIEILVADDGSTDRTPKLVASLARHDHRIRYLRSRHNTGAAGEPRNRAIAQATGEFIAFLDSDDLLEPEALASMHEAAEAQQCDLVAAQTVRRRIASGALSGWRRDLYTQRRFIPTVCDYPALVADTISVAKLYRRSWLDRHQIRFREGITFEDIDFTLKAWCLADGLVVLPDVVYTWNVYPNKLRRTITQQRQTEHNLNDRLTALERCSDWLHGHSEYESVRNEIEKKFLDHDLFVYLNEFSRQTDQECRQQVGLLRPHVQRVFQGSLQYLAPMKQVSVNMLLAGDLEGVRQATQFDRALGGLAGRCAIDGEQRVLWQPITATESTTSSSMTGWPVMDTPFAALPLYSKLEQWSVVADSIHASGVVHDPQGKLAKEQEAPFAVVELTRYQHAERFFVRATLTRLTRHSYGWSLSFGIPKGMPIAKPNRWDLWLHVGAGLLKNRSRISAAIPSNPTTGATAPGKDALLGRRYGLYTGGLGVLCLRKVEKHDPVTRVLNAVAVWGATVLNRLRPARARAATRILGDLDDPYERRCAHEARHPAQMFQDPGQLDLPTRRGVVLWRTGAHEGQLLSYKVDEWAQRYGDAWYVLVVSARRGTPKIRKRDSVYIWDVTARCDMGMLQQHVDVTIHGSDLVSAFERYTAEGAETP